jgi:tetratricopeptide (TPR) repeat protein
VSNQFRWAGAATGPLIERFDGLSVTGEQWDGNARRLIEDAVLACERGDWAESQRLATHARVAQLAAGHSLVRSGHLSERMIARARVRARAGADHAHSLLVQASSVLQYAELKYHVLGDSNMAADLLLRSVAELQASLLEHMDEDRSLLFERVVCLHALALLQQDRGQDAVRCVNTATAMLLRKTHALLLVSARMCCLAALMLEASGVLDVANVRARRALAIVASLYRDRRGMLSVFGAKQHGTWRTRARARLPSSCAQLTARVCARAGHDLSSWPPDFRKVASLCPLLPSKKEAIGVAAIACDVARFLNERGIHGVFRYIIALLQLEDKQVEAAQANLVIAVDLAESVRNFLLLEQAAMKFARVCIEQRRADAAIAFLSARLALAAQSRNTALQAHLTFVLADLENDLGRYEEAYAHCRECLQRAASIADPLVYGAALLLLSLAERRQADGGFVRAAEAIRASLAQLGDHGAAPDAGAGAIVGSGAGVGAGASASGAVALPGANDDDVAVCRTALHGALAVALQRVGRTNEACDEALKGVRVPRGHLAGEAWVRNVQLAVRLCLDLVQPDTAHSALNFVLAQRTVTPAQRAEFAYYRGKVYAEENRMQEAAAQFNKALDLLLGASAVTPAGELTESAFASPRVAAGAEALGRGGGYESGGAPGGGVAWPNSSPLVFRIARRGALVLARSDPTAAMLVLRRGIAALPSKSDQSIELRSLMGDLVELAGYRNVAAHLWKGVLAHVRETHQRRAERAAMAAATVDESAQAVVARLAAARGRPATLRVRLTLATSDEDEQVQVAQICAKIGSLCVDPVEAAAWLGEALGPVDMSNTTSVSSTLLVLSVMNGYVRAGRADVALRLARVVSERPMPEEARATLHVCVVDAHVQRAQPLDGAEHVVARVEALLAAAAAGSSSPTISLPVLSRALSVPALTGMVMSSASHAETLHCMGLAFDLLEGESAQRRPAADADGDERAEQLRARLRACIEAWNASRGAAGSVDSSVLRRQAVLARETSADVLSGSLSRASGGAGGRSRTALTRAVSVSMTARLVAASESDTDNDEATNEFCGLAQALRREERERRATQVFESGGAAAAAAARGVDWWDADSATQLSAGGGGGTSSQAYASSPDASGDGDSSGNSSDEDGAADESSGEPRRSPSMPSRRHSSPSFSVHQSRRDLLASGIQRGDEYTAYETGAADVSRFVKSLM